MFLNLPLVKTKIAPYATNNSETKRSFMTPGDLVNLLAMFQFNSTSILNPILYRYSRQDTSKWRPACHAYIRKLKITLKFIDFNALLISNAVFDAILGKMNWRRSLHSVDTAGERHAYVLLNLNTCEIGNEIGFPGPSWLCPVGRGVGVSIDWCIKYATIFVF